MPNRRVDETLMLNWQNQLEALKRDRKKSTLLALCLGVGMLLWGRLILLDRVPKSAVADDAVVIQPSDGVQTLGPTTVVYVGRLPDTAARDIFTMDPNRYKRDPRADNHVKQGKIAQPTVDVDPKWQAARDDAMTLTLESVIIGERPRVIIDGQVLQTGQEIKGFKLLAIHRFSAVLARDGFVFRLQTPRVENPATTGIAP